MAWQAEGVARALNQFVDEGFTSSLSDRDCTSLSTLEDDAEEEELGM